MQLRHYLIAALRLILVSSEVSGATFTAWSRSHHAGTLLSDRRLDAGLC